MSDEIVDFLRPIPGDRDGRCVADAILLGGVYSPGLANVAGAGTPRDWDVRKGYAFSGATVVYTGDNVAHFDVAITLFTQTQLDEWRAFYKRFLQRPPRKPLPTAGVLLPSVQPKALGIGHPVLEALEITSVVVEDVTQFNVDDRGAWTCTIKFLQYRPPLPMLGKPVGQVPAASKLGDAVEGTFADKLSFQIGGAQADLQGLKTEDAALGGF